MNLARIGALLAVIIAGAAQAADPLTATDISALPPGAYIADDGHKYITLSYSHMGLSTPVIRFTDFDADLTLDSANPENSSITVTVPVAGIDSGVADLDEHLKNADFFEVETYPTATFVSTGITRTGPTTGELSGELTIKGITKPVTLQATLNAAGPHPMGRFPTLGVNATGLIKRSDWGLTRALPHVGDEITLNISVEFHQPR